MFGLFRKAAMPSAEKSLPGRDAPAFEISDTHAVLGTPLKPPFPDGMKQAVFGLGCFWGAERIFWQAPGVFTTAVGYAAGFTPHPTYQEVCSGMTGHNEVVLVVYDPAETSLEALVRLFFESHDPTQGMRQGNDVGTQYRSGIYLEDAAEREIASAIKEDYEVALNRKGYSEITTEILPMPEFFHAEEYHQQYLHKNPFGYCGLGGTGIACPMPATAAE
jgi:peptide-methionine (S)-S-oxide reductase